MNIDGDVIISLSKSEEGLLLSPRVRVYCKKDDDYQQIGFIQHLKLESDAKEIPIDFKIAMTQIHPDNSEPVKKAINDYTDLLRENGVTLVNHCICEVRDGAVGIDPKCPVHFSD